MVCFRSHNKMVFFLMKCGRRFLGDGSVSMRRPAAGNLKPPSVAVCPWELNTFHKKKYHFIIRLLKHTMSAPDFLSLAVNSFIWGYYFIIMP